MSDKPELFTNGLAAYLADIGCTCDPQIRQDEEMHGAPIFDITHEAGCPVCRKIIADRQ